VEGAFAWAVMAGERIGGACWCLEECVLDGILEKAYQKENMMVTLDVWDD